MLADTIPQELPITQEDIAYLCSLVDRLAAYAGAIARRHDLGLGEDVVARHLNATRGRIASTLSRLTPGPPRLRPADGSPFRVPTGSEPWNFRQTLRYATGAAMISQRYARRMTEADLQRALLAKILFKCQTGILDDVVDLGTYGYVEVRDLYHHVLSSMTAPRLDPHSFRAKLALLLQQDQFSLYDLVNSIVGSFNRLYHTSPRGFEFFSEMERLDHQVAVGQALSVLQKDAFLDLRRVKSIASGFASPSSDLSWHERLASYVSGGTRYNLVDLCFTTVDDPAEDFRSMATAWYYFDIAIVYLNNVVAVEEDLRDGIVNLSLVAMREPEVLGLRTTKGYDPRLAPEDYFAHFERLGEIMDRALRYALNCGPDADQYHPFIATMIPVVMMAEWIGARDEYIDAFVTTIEPSVREAVRTLQAPEVPRMVAQWSVR